MELIEIIIYVLKLFSLSSFILLTLSYFFFKLKDRTRIKPYMLISTDPAAYEVPEEKEAIEKTKAKKYTRRFKVINEERIIKQEYNQKWKGETKPEFFKIPIIPVAPAIVKPANIYNFYSPNISEPMHKLKLSVR